MAESSTYGTLHHCWIDELPLAALEAAREWAIRLQAGDANAMKLVETLRLQHSRIDPADPRCVAGSIFSGLLHWQEALDLDPDPFDDVFGAYAGWVSVVWHAWEDDSGYAAPDPDELQGRARGRLRAGVASPADLPYLLRQAAAT